MGDYYQGNDNSASTSKAKKVAKAKHKKHNRKRHKKVLRLPFDPMIEAGTVYNLQGFGPDWDGPWLVFDAHHDFDPHNGSETHLELMKCIQDSNFI
jgi:hypothetical protein